MVPGVARPARNIEDCLRSRYAAALKQHTDAGAVGRSWCSRSRGIGVDGRFEGREELATVPGPPGRWLQRWQQRSHGRKGGAQLLSPPGALPASAMAKQLELHLGSEDCHLVSPSRLVCGEPVFRAGLRRQDAVQVETLPAHPAVHVTRQVARAGRHERLDHVDAVGDVAGDIAETRRRDSQSASGALRSDVAEDGQFGVRPSVARTFDVDVLRGLSRAHQGARDQHSARLEGDVRAVRMEQEEDAGGRLGGLHGAHSDRLRRLARARQRQDCGVAARGRHEVPREPRARRLGTRDLQLHLLGPLRDAAVHVEACGDGDRCTHALHVTRAGCGRLRSRRASGLPRCCRRHARCGG